MEADAVGAFRDFEDERVAVAFLGVVLEQTGAQAAGFYADGVVDGWIVGDVAVEDVDGDAVLLELLAGVALGVMDDVAEKELTAMRPAEGAGAKDAVELSGYGAIVAKRWRWKARRGRAAAR